MVSGFGNLCCMDMGTVPVTSMDTDMGYKNFVIIGARICHNNNNNNKRNHTNLNMIKKKRANKDLKI